MFIKLISTFDFPIFDFLYLNFTYLTMQKQALKGALEKNRLKSKKYLWEIPQKEFIIKLHFKFLA